MARVTVIIPVKNRAEKLRRALLSVLHQTVSELDIVVVENNSFDISAIESVVTDIGDARIRLFSMKECRNTNVARNYGVSLALSDVVAFLDSDDEWDCSHLERSLEILDIEGADFVYGGAKIFDGISEVRKASRQILASETPEAFLFGRESAFAQTSSFLVRKKCFLSVEWDEALAAHQDYDYFIRMCRRFKVRYNPAITCTVHWLRGEKRTFNLPAFKFFLARYRRSMSLEVEARYLYGMLKESIKFNHLSALPYYVLNILYMPLYRIGKFIFKFD